MRGDLTGLVPPFFPLIPTAAEAVRSHPSPSAGLHPPSHRRIAACDLPLEIPPVTCNSFNHFHIVDLCLGFVVVIA